MDSTREAFFQVCTEAERREDVFVTLYCDDRFFGGPEEGGWYGTDTRLIASQRVYSRQIGDQIAAQAKELADKLTRDAEDDRNRQCAAECEWLEARGLDDDFLPQPNGGERYWIAVEAEQGAAESQGDRAYS
jgi:hypothetical protein